LVDCLGHDETSKTKKNLTRRIGIEVVIMKKLCKQEVIGMRIHQFKVVIEEMMLRASVTSHVNGQCPTTAKYTLIKS